MYEPLSECASYWLHIKAWWEKILVMEKKYDKQFKIVFQAIYQLMQVEEERKKQIGFKTDEDDK